MKIPLYKPYICPEDKEAVIRVLDSGVLSRGYEVEKFEEEFAEFVNKKYAVAVSSGTNALHIALKAMNFKEGDEIITTPFSYIASSNVLLYEKLKPVFLDIDPQTLNLDPNKVENFIDDKTKGILLVHTFGLPAYCDEYSRIAKEKGVIVIEDACEAIGKPTEKFKVGKVGKATVYSFYSNKIMTTAGEGGMIVTDCETTANYCKALRDQGRSIKKDWLNHVILGYSYRMTEIQAAMGRVQLKRLPSIINKRREIAGKYNQLLADIPNINLPFTNENLERSWFTFFINFPNPDLCNKVSKALLENDIQTQQHFVPIYKFPMYKFLNYKDEDFPICSSVSGTCLTLPFFIGITDDQIAEVAELIKGVLK